MENLPLFVKTVFRYILLLLAFVGLRQPANLSEKAMVFAFWQHMKVGQFYDGWKPYIYHLRMVANFARRYMPEGLSEAEQQFVLAACYLHDIIEDARLTYNDIKTVFGVEVAEICYALTNDKGKNRKERAGRKYYQGIVTTKFATFVKLCDRAANATYSKLNGTRMFGMYKGEQFNFMSQLSPIPDDSIDIANYLETLFGNPATWVSVSY